MTAEREPLTEAQQRVYDFIETFLDRNEYPPTIAEICAATGIRSKSTVHGYIREIEAKGHIEIVGGGNRYRALRLVKDEVADAG